MLLLALLGTDAPCETPLDNAALAARAQELLGAYERYEIPLVRERGARLEQELRCAAEPLTPGVAAQLHLALGVARWSQEQAAEAGQLWAAARQIDPALSPSEALFPLGSEERGLWDAVAGLPPELRPLDPDGRWWVDGQGAAEVPESRPALVQELHPRQDLVLRTDLSSPAWPPPPSAGVARAPLLLGAGSLAVAAVGGTLWGRAYTQNAQAAQDGTWTRDYYEEDVLPAWRAGRALTLLGGVGLVGGGIWFTVGAAGRSGG